jgi:hypothetical protein
MSRRFCTDKSKWIRRTARTTLLYDQLSLRALPAVVPQSGLTAY